jgi:hypothetical protein
MPKTDKKHFFLVKTGKSFHVKVVVQKTDPQFVAPDVSLRITLPPEICLQKTKTTTKGPAAIVLSDGNIYWVDFTFTKKGKRRFGLKARVGLDYTNMTVPVQVSAYSLANNCTTTATLNIPVVHGGKLSHARQRNTGGFCFLPPGPPGNTTDPFIVVGLSQKCKEGILTPFRRLRRELTFENGNKMTSEECYDYCENTEGYVPPFYFNIEVSPDPNAGYNCYWYVMYTFLVQVPPEPYFSPLCTLVQVDARAIGFGIACTKSR